VAVVEHDAQFNSLFNNLSVEITDMTKTLALELSLSYI